MYKNKNIIHPENYNSKQLEIMYLMCNVAYNIYWMLFFCSLEKTVEKCLRMSIEHCVCHAK